MKKTWWHRLVSLTLRSQTEHCPRSQRKRRPALAVEQLEDRWVPSTISWVNRGTSDYFDTTFGSNASAARTIVDRAITDWQNVVQNFNYQGGGNTFSLTVDSMNLGSSRGSTWNISTDVQGKPTAAVITLDDDGAGGGW